MIEQGVESGIADRISERYAGLSPQERRAADALLAHLDDLAIYRAAELADLAGVSKATMSRLFRHLGFDDFSEVRDHLRRQRSLGVPVAVDGAPSLAAHLEHEVANLHTALSRLDEARLGEAAGLVARAGRVVVWGMRSSYPVALHLRQQLAHARTGVTLAPQPGQSTSEELLGLGAADTAVVVAFRRRPAGVADLLRDFAHDIVVCDHIVIGDEVRADDLDVVLYDTYGRTGAAAEAVRTLAGLDQVSHVAVFSLDVTAALVQDAKEAGASGVLSKALGAERLRDAIVRIADGEVVVAVDDLGSPALAELDWPGKADGLSERESQVLVLVAEGLTNKEIAALLYVSVETVKTHLRQILAKLRLRNRVEATAYVFRTGAFARYRPANPDDAERTPPGS